VTVHDIGQDEGTHGYRHYIVMEYVQGQTLKALIREQVATQSQPLPVELALNLGIQISAGIGYAHRAGLVHCDVKPQNVLVTSDGRVKVADFGIARAMSEASRQTASLLWGTPHYFSPEQAAGESATPASDVYAIGVILFEMLAGRLPFEADTLPALALKHMHESPPALTELNAAVPAQLAQIVAKVLSKEPAGRYRTAGQLERILRSYRESSQQETGPVLPVMPPATSEDSQPVPVAERPTELFRRDGGTVPVAEGATEMVTVSRGQVSAEEQGYGEPQDLYLPVPGEMGIDRRLLLLTILAIGMLLGLIPLWYLVARAWGVLG
jgi:serine/threonine-protein kinase